MNQYVKVPAPLLQWVMNYLANRPYAEVAEAIQNLGALKVESDEPAADTESGS